MVIGVNKYSHDTGVCIARQDTGKVETSETVDFSNADEVDKYIKQTATLRARAKCSPETEPAAPQQRG